MANAAQHRNLPETEAFWLAYKHHAIADIADMQQGSCQLLDIGVLFLVGADRDRLLADLALTPLDCASGRDSFSRAVFLPDTRVSEMA